MAYPYPRTVAEMIPARKAEVEAHAVPACRAHGPMTLRPLKGQTYEQMFCGLHYDCADCRSSVLIPSRDLAHHLGEPYNDGRQWWQHDGTTWQPISDAEAEAFRQRRAAEREEYQRRAAAAARKSRRKR